MTTLDKELLDIITKEFSAPFSLTQVLNVLENHKKDFVHSRQVHSSLSDLVELGELVLDKTDKYSLPEQEINSSLMPEIPPVQVTVKWMDEEGTVHTQITSAEEALNDLNTEIELYEKILECVNETTNKRES